LISAKGIIPALSTPVTEDGAFDEEGQRSVVRFNLDRGAHAVAASIIVGEFFKFSDEERKRILRVIIDEVGGKVPVWAGISHMGTEPCVALGRYAKDLGADGIIAMPALVSSKEASSALYEHFSMILGRVDLPLMIQDSEDFNGIRIPETVLQKLAAEHDNLVAVKVEGGKTLEKLQSVKQGLGGRVSILGGMEAKLLLEELESGSDGNIPDCCFPDLIVEAYEAFRAGKLDLSRATFARYKPWVDFLGRYPQSVVPAEKLALKARGIIRSSTCRLPFVPLPPEGAKECERVVERILARR
jgi:4-hydroxy-tetrahydrodipicolinate synthase